jgi:DNA-binding transcriptional LysR family regulator
MVAEGAGFAVVDAVTAAKFGDRLVIRRLRPTVTFPVQVLALPGRRMSLLAERFLALVRSEVAGLAMPGNQ